LKHARKAGFREYGAMVNIFHMFITNCTTNFTYPRIGEPVPVAARSKT